ncbi:MAG TPA: hypothetical protein VGA77_05185 [Propylenella sp.]
MFRAARIAFALALFTGAAGAQEASDTGGGDLAPALVAPILDYDFDAPESLSAPVPYAPEGDPPAALLAGELHELVLEVRLAPEHDPLRDGVMWRVFASRSGEAGELPVVAEAQGGTVTVQLPSGDYLVHAAFGRAGATKRVTVADDDQMESLVLDAGGMKLDSVVGADVPIPPENLTLEVMQEDENGDLVTIVPNAVPGRVLRLSAGTYHVISRYGGVNAVVRADIEVEPGKLTEAVMRHAGAEITLKLVAEAGGEALANTSWTVITQDGNTVHESIGAFPSIILATGDYTAVAAHQDNIYSRDFTVEAGIERDIEVRLADLVRPEPPPAGLAGAAERPMEP